MEEYDYCGTLRFEGEYLKGKKWNGKGYDCNGNEDYEIKNGKGKIKEYNWFNGNIIFEGDYLNGEKIKGKEYNDKNELIFEGEYLDGKKWKGKIKEYRYGYLMYDGEISKGVWNGKGKEYNEDGKLICEGEYLNGKKIK